MRSRTVLLAAIAALIAYPVLVGGFALSTAASRHADVAVVLGNAVSRDGRPSPRLRARLDEALRLYRHETVRRILVSGGIEAGSGVNEARAMAGYLREHGVPESAIIEDANGSDTMHTACNAAAILGPGTRIVAVSQWFHLPRTMLALKGCGIAQVSGAWPRWAEARDAYSFARELIALPAYALRLAVRKPATERGKSPAPED